MIMINPVSELNTRTIIYVNVVTRQFIQSEIWEIKCVFVPVEGRVKKLHGA